MPAPRSLLLGVFVFLLAAPSTQALIMVGRGNSPVHDQNWRQGALDVANLRCRIGYWEGPPFGGGMWNFLYRGDTDAFNAALQAFGKVRAPALELLVRAGPAECTFLRDEKDPKSDPRYDWDFVIWNVRSYYDLYGNPKGGFPSADPNFRQPLPPPRMTVYVGGPGLVDWARVVIPKGIRVIDQRASAAGVNPGDAAIVAGNVFDMATSKPLPGAKITIDKHSQQGKYEVVVAGEVDGDGRFSIENVPPGTYRIWVSTKGYAPIVAGYEQLRAGGYRAFDDIELCPEASMSGTVADAAGKPIAGATVHADDTVGLNGMGYRLPDSAQATTDADGKFEIPGLPSGFARPLCFAKDYHAPLTEPIAIPAKDVSIRMSSTGTIKGKGIGADGNQPKGQVVVNCAPEGGSRVGSWGGSMYAGTDGTFKFENVPPGKYIIPARPNPGRDATPANETTITVTAGKTVELELKLD